VCIIESTQVLRFGRICRPNYTSFHCEISLPEAATRNELIVCSLLAFVAIGAWGVLHSGTSSVIRGLVLAGR
jgi:hypothetical protein